MFTDTVAQPVLFADLCDRPLQAAFDQTHASSDGGAVLPKVADRRLGLRDLLAQRVYGIACGHADANDADTLADDPIAGDRLASQPTISRFEGGASPRTLYRLGEAFGRHRHRAASTVPAEGAAHHHRSRPHRGRDPWRVAARALQWLLRWLVLPATARLPDLRRRAAPVFGKLSEKVDPRQLRLALEQLANESGAASEPVEMDSGETPVRSHTRGGSTGRRATPPPRMRAKGPRPCSRPSPAGCRLTPCGLRRALSLGADRRGRLLGTHAPTLVEALDTDPAAALIVSLIQRLYQVEREAAHTTPADRQARRQAHSVPILAQIDQARQRLAATTLPKAPLGDALRYLGNQWGALQREVEDGRLLR